MSHRPRAHTTSFWDSVVCAVFVTHCVCVSCVFSTWCVYACMLPEGLFLFEEQGFVHAGVLS